MKSDPANSRTEHRSPAPASMDRWELLILVVCLAAVVVAIGYSSRHQMGALGVESDFYGSYGPQAERLRAGEAYTYKTNPPGYPLLVVLVSFLTGDTFVAGKWISVFVAGLFPWFTFRLLRSLFDRRAAFAAALLAAAAAVPYSFIASTDLLGGLLAVLCLWVFLRSERTSWRTCLFTGVLCGIAYLVRGQFIFLAVGLIGSLVVLPLNTDLWPRRWRNAALLVLAFAVVTTPWFIYNWKQNGSAFSSTNHLQMAAHFFHPKGDMQVIHQWQIAEQFPTILDVLAHDPPRLLRRYLIDVLIVYPQNLATYGLGYPAFLLAGAGLVFLLLDLNRRRSVFLLVSLLGYALLGLAGFYLRYYMFLFPLLFLSVTYLLFHRRLERLAEPLPRLRVAPRWLILGVIALAVLGLGLRRAGNVIEDEPRHLVEAAETLRQQARPGDVVYSKKPHIGYLSGVKSFFREAESPEGFLEEARSRGSRFLVYTEAAEEYSPGMGCLRDPAALPPEFRLIYRRESPLILIYELSI